MDTFDIYLAQAPGCPLILATATSGGFPGFGVSFAIHDFFGVVVGDVPPYTTSP